jgi:hypothetical protein
LAHSTVPARLRDFEGIRFRQPFTDHADRLTEKRDKPKAWRHTARVIEDPHMAKEQRRFWRFTGITLLVIVLVVAGFVALVLWLWISAIESVVS